MTGGQYDVDVVLEGPKNDVLYRQIRSQFDSHQFTAEVFQGDFDQFYIFRKLITCLVYNVLTFS